MGKSLTDTAKSLLEGANADTLKPKSKGAMPPESLGSATKLGDAPVKGTDGNNLGQAAAAPVSKNSDAQTKSAKAPEPTKKLNSTQDVQEEEEVEGDVVAEEEIEISEELAAFIEKMIEEGATEEEIEQAIEENFEFVTEESDKEDDDDDDEDEDDDEDDKDDDKKDMNEEIKVDMTEHVNALLEGETLSEEFKAKATTIFESAVNAKIQEEVKKLRASYEEALEEEVKAIQEELATKLDDYLNYVVEQWMAENEVAIEASLRTELTEDFISSLRQVFAEHYIEIPDDKVSVVEELGEKVEELEAKLNEEIARNVELNKMINESHKNEIFNTVVEGLTDIQADKLKTLAEGLEFTTADEYSAKIKTLRENYFPSVVNSQKELDSVEPGTEGKSMIQEELSNRMAQYTKVLGKKLPN